MDAKQELLRHAVATLAYRGSKVIRGVPDGFAELSVCDGTRRAVEILAHIGDVLEWAVHTATGQTQPNRRFPRSWKDEVARYYKILQRLDDVLAKSEIACRPENLLQGPIADALTHIGQLATLRRLAGSPVRGENYFEADIVDGRVGADQAPARFEFD